MKKIYRFCIASLLISFIFSVSSFGQSTTPFDNEKAKEKAKLNNQSTCFIENKGQWNDDILFLQKSKNITSIISTNSIIFNTYTDINNATDGTFRRSGTVVKMKFIGANPDINYQINNDIGQTYNFFYGKDEKKWATGVKSYDQVVLKKVYNGIDVELIIENGHPRYNFIIAPGGDPSNIKLAFEGQTGLKFSKSNLIIQTNIGELNNTGLFAYQNVNGEKVKIEAGFRQNGDNISFDLGKYDATLPVVIDPIVFATCFGGSDIDEITDLALGSNYDFVISGNTKSINLKTTPGTYDSLYNSDYDLFISKIHLKGADQYAVFTTYIGGGQEDKVVAIALDDKGDIYMTGTTNSTDYPLKKAFALTFNGGIDSYITKLSADGTQLYYSSYIGGGKDDYATDIAVTPDYYPIVVGYTNSTNFPIQGGVYQNKNKGLIDGFITKIIPSGTGMKFSTYFGGSNNDMINAIALDLDGSMYLTGQTNSGDFPQLPFQTGFGGSVLQKPYDYSYNGNWDAFVVKLIGDGGGAEYSTYFGGTADDIGRAIAVDGDGTVYFAGETSYGTGTKFPITTGSYSATHKGGWDGFLAKMGKIVTSKDGFGNTIKSQDIVFSTYFGNTGDESVSNMLRESSTGYVYITGSTNSSKFPVINDDSSKYRGKTDAYLIKFTRTGDNLMLSSLFGGSGDDFGKAIGLDERGDIYLAGSTTSKDIPNLSAANGNGYNGGDKDGFIAKFVDGNITITNPSGKEVFCPGTKQLIRWANTNFTMSDTFSIDFKRKTDMTWRNITTKASNQVYSWTLPLDAPAGTDYILRIVHNSGIVREMAYPFTILELPSIVSVTTQPDNNIVCENSQFKVTVSAKGKDLKYKWYFQNTLLDFAKDSVLVLNTTTYNNSGKIKCEVDGFCDPAVTTKEIMMTITPATKVLSHAYDTTIKKGKDLYLKVSATGVNIGFQWYKDGNKLASMTDSVFSIQGLQHSHGGLYVCKVTGDCGTDSSFRVNLVVDTVTTGVHDYVINNSLKPNPVSDYFIISTKNLNNDYQIFDIFSSIVKEGIFTTEEEKINVSELPAGIYFLRSGNNLFRFIKL